jgi:hypothetical protein
MTSKPIRPISVKEHLLHWILIFGTTGFWLPLYLVRVFLKQRQINQLTPTERAEWKKSIKKKNSKNVSKVTAKDSIMSKVSELNKANQISNKIGTYTKRKFTSQDQSDDDEWSQFADDFSFEAVGESHYRENLLAIIEKHNAHQQGELLVDAVMQTEPDNKFDEFAVAIFVDGKKVGHVPSEYSFEVTTYLDEQNVTAIKVKAVLGWNIGNPNPPIGVRLDFNF